MSYCQNSNNFRQIFSDPVRISPSYSDRPLSSTKSRCSCSDKNPCRAQQTESSLNSTKSSKNVRFTPKLEVSKSEMAYGNVNSNKLCCCSNNKEKITQLKKELKTIKKCLMQACTKKKEEVDLQLKLQRLVEKNRVQRDEIEALKQTNRRLSQVVCEGPQTCKDVLAVQQNLDEYKNKLNVLYKEFLDSVRIMEEAKKRINKTVDEKSLEFQDLQLQFERKSAEFNTIKVAYDSLVGANLRLSQENEKLSKSIVELKDSMQQLVQLSVEKMKDHQEFSKRYESVDNQLKKTGNENLQLRKILQAFLEIVRDNERIISSLREFILSKNEEIPPEIIDNADKSKENYNLLHLIHELNQLMASMYQQIDESFKKDEIIHRQQQEIRNLQSTLINQSRGSVRFDTMASSISRNTDTDEST